MDIIPQIEAIKGLHASISLSAPIDALLKYTAARVITDRLLKKLDEFPEADRHERADYLAGKLIGFIQKLEWAVMPSLGAEKTPLEWLELARHDLLVAESKAPGV